LKPRFKKKTIVDPRIKDQQNVINKKLKDPVIREKLKHLSNLYTNKHELYPKNRGYKEYNYAFLQLLEGKPLLEFVLKRFKNSKKSKLTIMDEGAGLTRFLTEFKSLLEKRNINSETTAITLTPGVDLKNSKVDILVKQKSQNFKPFKKYDLITSVFGGVFYNISELDKNLILKFSHSLSRNGVFLFGTNRLKPLKNITVEEHINNIKRTMIKNGFRLDFKFAPSNNNHKLPTYIFKIERLP